MTTTLKIISWILRILAAFILLQTLYFKFTGAPESVYIFETLGMEPLGRYGSGVAELIASLLLIYPRTAAWGGLLGMGVMAGAILSHLTQLGIEIKAPGVESDGGLLFGMAVIVFVCCAVTVWIFREQLPFFHKKA